VSFFDEGRARGSTVVASPGACPTLSPTYGYERIIGDMWRASDLVECLIFVALALMLVYTVFVTARFLCRYFIACHEFPSLVADFTPAPKRGKKNLLAELSRGMGTLRSIASAASFLGLAGSCYGILLLSLRGYVGSRGGYMSAFSLEIPVALVATASGLIVALPAAISYNVLRTRLEKFESSWSSTLLEATPCSYGFAQTLALRGRFSKLPAFALIGSPVLALLIPMFALMLRSPIPVGLPVHLRKMGATDHDPAPIVISVIGTDPGDLPTAYVNSKETSWDQLDDAIRSQLQVRSRRIVYVEGGRSVPWHLVEYPIDVARGLHAEVVLLTATPQIEPPRKDHK
jgi:hypothetical protein